MAKSPPPLTGPTPTYVLCAHPRCRCADGGAGLCRPRAAAAGRRRVCRRRAAVQPGGSAGAGGWIPLGAREARRGVGAPLGAREVAVGPLLHLPSAHTPAALPSALSPLLVAAAWAEGGGAGPRPRCCRPAKAGRHSVSVRGHACRAPPGGVWHQEPAAGGWVGGQWGWEGGGEGMGLGWVVPGWSGGGWVCGWAAGGMDDGGGGARGMPAPLPSAEALCADGWCEGLVPAMLAGGCRSSLAGPPWPHPAAAPAAAAAAATAAAAGPGTAAEGG